MEKYKDEFKLRVVKTYLEGSMGHMLLATRFNILNESQIKRWIRAYKEFGEAGTNMSIVVNDHEMSIADNYGGLYENLRELRETEGKSECNFFKTMGFDYHCI